MAQYQATFKDFTGADGFLGERNAAKVGHETTVRRLGDDGIALQYHWTDVVVYRRDGTVELYNGGWVTNHTRERLRSFSPVDVRQVRGSEVWIANGQRRPFTGSLVLSPKVVRKIKAGEAL